MFTKGEPEAVLAEAEQRASAEPRHPPPGGVPTPERTGIMGSFMRGAARGFAEGLGGPISVAGAMMAAGAEPRPGEVSPRGVLPAEPNAQLLEEARRRAGERLMAFGTSVTERVGPELLAGPPPVAPPPQFPTARFPFRATRPEAPPREVGPPIPPAEPWSEVARGVGKPGGIRRFLARGAEEVGGVAGFGVSAPYLMLGAPAARATAEAVAARVIGKEALRRSKSMAAIDFMSAVASGKTESQAARIAQRTAAAQLRIELPGLAGAAKRMAPGLAGAVAAGAVSAPLLLKPQPEEDPDEYLGRVLAAGPEGALYFALYHLGIRGVSTLVGRVFGAKPPGEVFRVVEKLRTREPLTESDAYLLRDILDAARKKGVEIPFGYEVVKPPAGEIPGVEARPKAPPEAPAEPGAPKEPAPKPAPAPRGEVAPEVKPERPAPTEAEALVGKDVTIQKTGVSGKVLGVVGYRPRGAVLEIQVPGEDRRRHAYVDEVVPGVAPVPKAPEPAVAPAAKPPKKVLELPEGVTEEGVRRLLPIEEGDEVLSGSLKELRRRISEGAPGGRVRIEGEEGLRGFPSTYPKWFQDKNYSRDEALRLIETALGKTPLTERQHAMLDDLLDGMIQEQQEEYDRPEEEAQRVAKQERAAIEEEGRRPGEATPLPAREETARAPEAAPPAAEVAPEAEAPPRYVIEEPITGVKMRPGAAPKVPPAAALEKPLFKDLPEEQKTEWKEYAARRSQEIARLNFPVRATFQGERVEILGPADTFSPYKEDLEKRGGKSDPTQLMVRRRDGSKAIMMAQHLVLPSGEPLMRPTPGRGEPFELPAPTPARYPIEPLPQRRLLIGRGAHGQVEVIFPDSKHKTLFSAVGRSRRQIAGEPTISPDWEGLAARFKVTQKEIGGMAVKYRDAVMDAIKDLEEGSRFTVPAYEEMVKPLPTTPAVPFEEQPTAAGVTVHQRQRASRYVNFIKNDAKRDYARLYSAWILGGEPTKPEPPAGLSVMAAQAVRTELEGILGAPPATPAPAAPARPEEERPAEAAAPGAPLAAPAPEGEAPEAETVFRLVVPRLVRALAEKLRKEPGSLSRRSELLKTAAVTALGRPVDETNAREVDLVHDALEGAATSEFRDRRAQPGDTLQRRVERVDFLEREIAPKTRTLEARGLQQFSTPMPLSELMAHALGARPGQWVLEPTAGTGSLLAPLQGVTTNLLLFELDPQRADVLRAIGYGPRVQDFLAAKPEVVDRVLTNPPWGSVARSGIKVPQVGPFAYGDVAQRFFVHAMEFLKPRGRIVALMPRDTIAEGGREFRNWVRSNFLLRAAIVTPSNLYAHRGTAIEGVLLVVDKVSPKTEVVPMIWLHGAEAPKDLEQLVKAVEPLGPGGTHAPLDTEVEGVPPTEVPEPTRPAPAAPPGLGGPRGGAALAPRPSPVPVAGRPARVEPEPGRAGVGPGLVPELAPARAPTRPPGAPAVVPRPAPGAPEPAQPRVTAHRDSVVEAKRQRDLEEARRSESLTPYVLAQPGWGSPHPRAVVESRSLAGVPSPAITVELSEPLMRANEEGWITDVAMDTIANAVEANLIEKHGYVSADAVGLGKSRQAAGFAWEMLNRGYKRIVVTTRNEGNIRGGDGLIVEFNKAAGGAFPYPMVVVRDVKEAARTSKEAKAGARGTLPTYERGAVYFLDYYAMTRYLDAVLELKPDAIIGDEAHLFRNENADVGASWDEIHKQMLPDPNSAFLYLTATLAQDAEDLRYLHGLKLWVDFDEWLAKMTGKLAWRAGHYEYAEPSPSTPAWVSWKIKQRAIAFIKEYVDSGAPWNRFPSPWNLAQGWKNELFDSKQATKDLLEEYTRQLERSTVEAIQQEAELQVLYKGVDAQAPPEVEGAKGRKAMIRKNTVFEHTIPPAEIEQWMRELKMQRHFGSRELWRGGAEFEAVELALSPEDKASYDRMRELARDATVAFMKYNQKNAQRRVFSNRAWVQAYLKRAQFHFKLPHIIDRAEADLKSGHQPVISIINVNETKEDEGNIFTAIQAINTEHVVKSQEAEGGYEDLGEIPEAVAEKAELLERAKELGTLASPLKLIERRFGPAAVANVTGATSEGRSWTADRRMQDLAAFQSGKKSVLVLSQAGKVGISAHHVTPTPGPATGRRAYHLADYEWSAIMMYQELGRVDRTGQLTAPRFLIYHTGSLAERKFVASVANRMKMLGATSRGSAEVGAGGEFAAFEFGGRIDNLALRRAYEKAPTDIKELFTYRQFKDPYSKEPYHLRPPARNTTAGPHEFLMDFQLFPEKELAAFQDLWLKEREAIENEGLFDTSGDRTGRVRGKVLRSTQVEPSLILHEVQVVAQDEHTERMGILQGIVTPSMNQVLESIGRDKNGDLPSRKFVAFREEGTERVISGLRVPITRVRAVAGALGVRIGGEQLTSRDVMEALGAGDRVDLDNGWTLSLRKDGLVEIHGAGMKAAAEKGLTERDAAGRIQVRHGARYLATKNVFYLPLEQDVVVKFLDRFPLKGQVQMQASQDIRRKEAGFVRIGLLAPIDPNRFRVLSQIQSAVTEVLARINPDEPGRTEPPAPPEELLPAPTMGPGRRAEHPEFLPPEPRATAQQARWIRGMAAHFQKLGLDRKTAVAKANDLWHGYRRIITAGEIVLSSLSRRNKDLWRGYDEATRKRVMDVYMSVRRDPETGDLVMGAWQPFDTLTIRRKKGKEYAVNDDLSIALPLDQVLEGGLLPGDLIIGGRLDGRAEIQLYKVIRPEAAKIAYDSLVQDKPEAKDLLEQLTAAKEELSVDPLTQMIHMPPVSRSVAKELYRVGVSHPPQYAHAPMRLKEPRTFVGRLRRILTRRRSVHRLRTRGILFRKQLYEHDPKVALYRESQTFIREEVADELLRLIFPFAERLGPGEGVPEGYAALDRSFIKNPDAFAAFVDRNREDLAERGLDPKELISFAYQMGGQYVVPQEIKSIMAGLLEPDKHSADPLVREVMKATKLSADWILSQVLSGYLLRPVYSVRNFGTNAFNHLLKTWLDLHVAVLEKLIPPLRFSEAPFAYFVSDIEAPLLSARPFNRELREMIPDEMLGQVFVDSMGMRKSGVLREVIRIQGGKSGDVYWNRVVWLSVVRGYARNLYSYYQRTGEVPIDMPEGRLMPFEQFFKMILKSVPIEVERAAYKWLDTYGAFDYRNMPPEVDAWTKSILGRGVVPFPKWFVKEWGLTRSIYNFGHYKRLFSSDSSHRDRVYALAWIMLGAELVDLVWSLIPDSYEDMPEGIDQSVLPYELRTKGYFKLGGPFRYVAGKLLRAAEPEEVWLRAVDLPVVGWATFVKYFWKDTWKAVTGQDFSYEDARELLEDKMSLGPLPLLVAPLFNLVEEYSKYKPMGERMAEFLFRQVPLSPHLELLRRVIDPERKGLAKQTDSFADAFWHGMKTHLPKLSLELKVQRERTWPHRALQYDLREAIARFTLWNLKIIDPTERAQAINRARTRELEKEHPGLKRSLKLGPMR